MKYNLKCIDFTATYYQNGAIAPKEKNVWPTVLIPHILHM